MAVPYMLLITYFAWIFVKISFLQGEGSESLTGIPNRYIVKSFTLIGFSILLFACTATLLRIWVYLFGTEDEKERALGKLEIFPDEITPEAIVGTIPGADDEIIIQKEEG